MKHALILSGAGRYSDPWHPYADTSARLASVVENVGLHCVIDSDVDAGMPRGDAHRDDNAGGVTGVPRMRDVRKGERQGRERPQGGRSHKERDGE